VHLYELLVIDRVASDTGVTLSEEVRVQRSAHVRRISNAMKLSISVILW
jgi:hypothetical protein